tara:strand:+ start:483 stop:587 length:105 start_codon:yes stop_codon:yes gene_type:complete
LITSIIKKQEYLIKKNGGIKAFLDSPKKPGAKDG